MTNMAGIFAIGVVALATASDVVMKDNLRTFISSEEIGWIHYGFAASFFIVLAVMSMINFRRAKNQALFGKGKDDPFFLSCGIIMLACLVLVPILSTVDAIQPIRPTFILEAIALIAFGALLAKKRSSRFYIFAEET